MIEKLKELMVGKTIAFIELESYQAQNDTLIIRFTESDHIKIRSDPKMVFEGLAFYIQKSKTVTYEEVFDEEIK
jgi:hypothetical protein